MRDDELAVCAVLSGNRNFEGRIHPLVRASYLASPPLVVAYALAGTIDIDLDHEPLGTGSDGSRRLPARHLALERRGARRDRARASRPSCSSASTRRIWDGDERWQALPAPEGALFDWDAASTYVREPSFFQDLAARAGAA